MIVERIIQYLGQKGISVSTFEKNLGLGNTTLSKAYRTGGSIGSDKIEKIISECKDLSPSWLLRGEGEMIIQEQKEEIEEKDELPLVPRELLAHIRSPKFSREQVEHYYNIRELNRRSDFLVEAKGDYMCPKYSGGDLIACRYVKHLLFFQWGRIYFISTRSQGEFIRRIQPSKDNDMIQCCSENPKYPPFDLPKSDIISIAIVKGAVSFE